MTEKEIIRAKIQKELNLIIKRIERDKNDPWEHDIYSAKLLYKIIKFIDSI